MSTFNEVFRQIGSKKVKERQEGLNSLRTLLHRDTVINRLADREALSEVFEALYGLVLTEKATCTQKTTKNLTSGAAAERRLTDAASTVRWLVERCVQRLNKSAMQSVMAHLLDTITYKGQLHPPIALAYIKTIRCILSYGPHLEHLGETTWTLLVEMGLSTILGDPLWTRFADKKLAEDASLDQGTDGDSDMYVEDELDGASPRKRRRRDTSATPGPSTSRATPSAPRIASFSQEQIEFADLLHILLQHTSAPVISSNLPFFASGILDRLRRFLHLYPMDSSLHEKFLTIISVTLSRVALNKRDAVTAFARGAWEDLIRIWGTKNRRMKEDLVVILRTLFPFYTSRDSALEGGSSSFDYTGGLARLWQRLDVEADNRWGIDGLSLDSLRLCILPAEEKEPCIKRAFVARTFQHGWDFDSNQALAWSILELQAECAAKLFIASESAHPSSRVISKREGKRAKLTDPVSSMLDAIQQNSTNAVRSYHLQTLLFFIDHHWNILHAALQQDVMSVLPQFISFDDPTVQSWTFLCLSAIAERQVASRSAVSSLGSTTTWDPIWTHAVRRSDVPLVSRSACHTAHILLSFSKRLLTPQRVLAEIEAFSQNLDVQGPPYPHDSVCIFMASCLQVAGQDMRLYRVHIEDKILAWLADSWSHGDAFTIRGGKTKAKMSRPFAEDVLLLLGSICSLPKRSSITSRMLLPESSIVDQIIEEQKTTIIRSFLLDAQLPSFRHPETSPSLSSITSSPSSSLSCSTGTDDLSQPGPRERKISAHLLKHLESLQVTFETSPEQVNADGTRHFVDWAVIAISFESLLVFNGIRSTRRLLQAACKLLHIVTPLIHGKKWSLEEQAFILLGFEPLVATGEQEQDDGWGGLMHPIQGTGIKRDVLKSLTSDVESMKRQAVATRRALQHIIWQGADVQDTFSEVLITIKDVLRSLLSTLDNPQSSDPMDMDTDDFAPIRRTPLAQASHVQKESEMSSAQTIVQVCVSVLALGPSLQSTSGEATRDRELTNIILNSDGDQFLLAGPAYFTHLRRQTLNINLSIMDNLLDKIGSVLPQYAYSSSEKLQMLVIQLLDSTMSLWLHPSEDAGDVVDRVDNLCEWLAKNLKKNRFRSWRTREAAIAFLHHYILQDPFETVWLSSSFDDSQSSIDPSLLPSSLIPNFNMDDDIPVFKGVSERMCLSRPSELFEIYVSQIAYSVWRTESDFLRFPPGILGFPDKRRASEAAFHAFTPVNILAGGQNPAIMARGRQQFAMHCNAIGKPVKDGVRETFADLVGYELTRWLDHHFQSDPLFTTEDVDADLAAALSGLDEELITPARISEHLDGIAVAILRTLGTQDVSQDGPIVEELNKLPVQTVQAFLTLTGYRCLDEIETYQPNLPSFGPQTVLGALRWLSDKVSASIRAPTSYHVIHQMFADIQRTPLVNEQMRLINAVCVWISLYKGHFRETSMLHTLLHSTTSMLAQSDLARAAQSILSWAFESIEGKLTGGELRITDVLIRISGIAYDYSVSPDTDTAELGKDLLKWLEGQLVKLVELPVAKPQIVQAMLAWPQEPCAELVELYKDASSEDISHVLTDHRIISNKFRVVRRLQDPSVARNYPESQFSRRDFWRLKDCIPPPGQLQADDIDAFLSLLSSRKGQVHGFGTYPLSSQVSRHPRLRTTQGKEDTPERAILEALLGILRSNVPTRVHTAYRVLRTIASGPLPDFASWSSEYTDELKHFRARPHPAITRAPADVATFIESNSFVDMAEDYTVWISTVATTISDALSTNNQFYGQLAPVLTSDPILAEQVLPILVHTLLRHRLGDPATRSTLSQYFTSILSSSTANTSSLSAVVNIVLYLRECLTSPLGDPLAHDKWLQIDFMLLSRSAIVYGAYTTALLFHELAAEYQADRMSSGETEGVLFDIYSHIDEPDSFYGIKTQDTRQFLIKRFHHEQQWDKAFRFHGAALEARSQDFKQAEGVLHSLHSFGFDHLALGIQQSTSVLDSGSGSSSMSYHLGWRTETWDLPEQSGPSSDFSDTLYQALRAVYRERDPRTVDRIVESSLSDAMDRLRTVGDEDLIGIREVTRNLLCLSQVKSWRSNQFQDDLQKKQLESPVWLQLNQIDQEFDFPALENVVASRISLLRSVRQKEQRQQIGTMTTPFVSKLVDVEKRCLIRVSEAARSSGNMQIALNSVVKAQQLESTPTASVSQEFANVLWQQGEHRFAVQYLKDILNRHPQYVNPRNEAELSDKALLLTRLGSWSSEACLEKPFDIFEHHFRPAAELIASRQPSTPIVSKGAAATVYHESAMFADRQYQAIMRSPDAVRWKMYTERKKKEIEQREEQLRKANRSQLAGLSNDQRKARALLEQDQERFEKHHEIRKLFLQQSLSMYSKCLATSDAFDEDTHIRLVSLWFANFDDVELQGRIGRSIDRVPSRKFVFLAHQLSARLATPKTGSPSKSQEALQTLILRMCREHPFHSVYPLFPLRPVEDAIPLGRRHSARLEQSQSQSQSQSQIDRSIAVGHLFQQLRSGKGAERVLEIERVCLTQLEWAKTPVRSIVGGDSKTNTTYQIPADSSIAKLKNARVPVFNVSTPVDPTMRYKDCVWIDHYEPFFVTLGGISLPKVTPCVGSDGVTYKQLFKGEGDDDLRQDAVMEQVFDVVNVVLKRDRETKRRNLCIRRYTVVPLAEQAGVMEFVGNSYPLANWLNVAHQRYRGDGISNNEFKKKLKETRDHNTKNPLLQQILLELFLDLRERFKPVMRHFFTEKHKNPMSWFAMRLNYTRSVATTSIVGHILGLGDRHTSNILIDNQTGEAVHIDLGIAFEQGKVLPTPERVPFRMTADMVDGMGTSGTQGVFQRCAEETLRVLRSGSEVILTVLEVFKYDPLHSWTASELKLKRAQDDMPPPIPMSTVASIPATNIGIGIDLSSGGADEAADRALSAVARKLDKALSVEYTVNELIAEATDPANLSAMFYGESSPISTL
ncbi:hypothetical protein OF83DRAFT_1055083 [Amylostereum chailletii]|nr:hypothetical protein OF83DRAFT_1055083 [Amylostereum chailletii]